MANLLQHLCLNIVIFYLLTGTNCCQAKIRVSELPDVLRNEAELRLEFHYARAGKAKSWDTAQRNVQKNRYKDLMAYDESRVVLNEIPGVQGSDYINANFIDGFVRKKEYVATQGPLESTINDFWRMVWQLNSRKIMMFANLIEHGQEKVAKYWPDESFRYGDILVSKQSEHSIDDHILRTFLVSNIDDGEPRVIKHFHFTGWSDSHVPTNPLTLLSILQQAKLYRQNVAAPMIMHCSDGIGRTGTAILIDTMIKTGDSTGQVNCINDLRSMRDQRIDLVEKEVQYLFAYEAVNKYFNGNHAEYFNSITESYKKFHEQDDAPFKEITLKLADISNNFLPHDGSLTHEIKVEELPNILENEDAIKTEFPNVSLGQRKPWSVASKENNLPKNRYDDLLAYDETRVVLDELPNIDDSDYINANYINGYFREKEYVATQGPLPNTIEDFWRMIWQLNARKIVMLANVIEHDKEKVAKYWPDDKKDYGAISITKLSEYEVADHVLRSFSVSKNGEEGVRIIKQFHYIGWPDFGVPQNRSSFLSIIREARNYRPADTVPLVVHCSAGVGRTGTAILTDSMINRGRATNTVDFLMQLDQMRNQRIDVVEKDVQYLFAHMAANDALSGFHEDFFNRMNAIYAEFHKKDRDLYQHIIADEERRKKK